MHGEFQALCTWAELITYSLGREPTVLGNTSPECASQWQHARTSEGDFSAIHVLLSGQPVGTSELFLSAGVAGIYNMTCIPEARGRGIGASITLARLLQARDMGYEISILQASQLGYNVYCRLGFQDFGKLSAYLWENER